VKSYGKSHQEIGFLKKLSQQGKQESFDVYLSKIDLGIWQKRQSISGGKVTTF